MSDKIQMTKGQAIEFLNTCLPEWLIGYVNKKDCVNIKSIVRTTIENAIIEGYITKSIEEEAEEMYLEWISNKTETDEDEMKLSIEVIKLQHSAILELKKRLEELEKEVGDGADAMEVGK